MNSLSWTCRVCSDRPQPKESMVSEVGGVQVMRWGVAPDWLLPVARDTENLDITAVISKSWWKGRSAGPVFGSWKRASSVPIWKMAIHEQKARLPCWVVWGRRQADGSEHLLAQAIPAQKKKAFQAFFFCGNSSFILVTYLDLKNIFIKKSIWWKITTERRADKGSFSNSKLKGFQSLHLETPLQLC